MKSNNSGSGNSSGDAAKHISGLHKYMDLRGMRFGKLLVIEPTDARSYKGSVIWRCKCDCGNETSVPQDSLMSGNTRSCGCSKKKASVKAFEKLTFIDGTCIEWLEKRNLRIDNTTGYTGVNKKENGKWTANISIKGKRFYIGVFNSKEQAVLARDYAKSILHTRFIDAYRQWEKEYGCNPDKAEQHPFHFELIEPDLLRKLIRKHINKLID